MTPYRSSSSTPKKSASQLLLRGAVGAAAGIMFVTSIVVVVRMRDGEKPEPVKVTTAPKASVSASPIVAAPIESDSVEPTPIDPNLPPSASSSLRDRPKWGAVDHTRQSPSNEYAPQLEVPASIFSAGKQLSGDVDDAFIICHARTFAKADSFLGDDVQVRANLGTTPLVAADGPEDANNAYISAAHASLKEGESATFEVYDRDVFSVNLITNMRFDYKRGPLRGANDGATMECRTLAGDALASEITKYAKIADKRTAELAATPFSVKKPHWNYPSEEVTADERRIADVAALGGWDHQAARDGVEKHDDALSTLHARRVALFNDTHDSATSDMTVDGITLHVEGVLCGPQIPANLAADPGYCVAHVTLTNGAARAVSVSPYATGAITLRLEMPEEEGTVLQLRNYTNIEGSSDVAPKATGDFAAYPLSPTGPLLASLCVYDRCGVVKLR